MRGKFVVGNWKMNGGLVANKALLSDLKAGWTATPGREIAVPAVPIRVEPRRSRGARRT